MSTESPTKNSRRPASEATAVAVIGLGALFPGSRPGVAGYWSLVKNGRDAITDIPADHFPSDDYYDPDPKARDRIYCRRGAFIPSVLFSPLKYGITPKDLVAIDTTQLLGLVIADEALKDAGYPHENFDHSRTAIILGVTGALKMVVSLGNRLVHPQLRRAVLECGLDSGTADRVVERFSEKFPFWSESSFPGLLGNVTAGRVANRLNLGGANMVVDAACASSLAALRQALTELRTHKADLVVSGGLDTFSDPFMFSCFSKTPALSPSGEVRSFDRRGDGTLLGEGVGLVILKRLDEALRDGDRIYASIVAVGGSSDGRGTAIFAPSPSGQRRALEDAYSEAGWSPDEVELVEAHGTGTAVGDGVELNALSEYFAGQNSPKGPWCALGSVKSQIGHAKGAAGVAGLIKAVLSLHHKVLPPTIKVDQPLDPLTDKNVPLFLNDKARPWLSAPGKPRRAAVSSFGFGGSNFHCLLMEAPGPRPTDIVDIHLIPLSEEDPAKLSAKLTELSELRDNSLLSARTDSEINYYDDAVIDSLSRKWAFNPNDRYRLCLTGTAGDIRSRARSILTKLSAPEGFDLDSQESVFGPMKDLSAEPLTVSFGTLPDSVDSVISLGPALMDLALSFPVIQEILDQAEGLRIERSLADHNLGLVISPPLLAPDEFKEELRQIQGKPAVLALIYSLTQISLAALIKSFKLPITGSQGFGLGLLASLFLDSRISADEALKLAVDLADHSDRADLADQAFLSNLPGPVLGPEGLYDSPQSFLAALRLASVQNTEFSPAVIRIGESHYRNILETEEPLRALADLLAFLADGRLYPDFSVWPAWPEETAAPTGYAVPVGGANLFREPEPITPEKPVGTEGPVALAAQSDQLSSAMAEILNNQRQGLALLKTLAQSQVQPNLGTKAINSLALGQDSVHVQKANHGSHSELGPVSVEVPQPSQPSFLADGSEIPGQSVSRFLTHLPTTADLASLPTDPLTGSQKGSGGNGKSNGSGLLAPSVPEAVWDRLTSLIADETGYPVEALTPDLELENDLGLDSIKKVELLSAITEIFPALAGGAVDLTQAYTLGALSRLCEVGLSDKADRRPADLGASGPENSAEGLNFELQAGSQPGAAKEILFEILSEETGYPLDSLNLAMHLENDLGLDSIKKVELLSALSEKFPATNSGLLAQAETLGEILEALTVKAEVAQPVPLREPPLSSEGLGPAKGLASVLEVVAAETGYPVDSLSPEMNLEEDLGLDSIKKVEILSLLTEGLAANEDQSYLAGAKTLGDWQNYFTRTEASVEPKALAGSQERSSPIVAAAGGNGRDKEGSFETKPDLGGGAGLGRKQLLGKEILDKLLGTGGRELPSLWQVEPALFSNGEHGTCLWPRTGLVRLVGSAPLAKALEREIAAQGFTVERRPWSFDFSRWRNDGQKPRILCLVWPGPDRDPNLITQALKALENTGDRVENIIGLSFLGGFFGFPKPGGLPCLFGNSNSGALVGLLKCAAREWPQVNIRVLDLPLALYQSPTPNWISAILEIGASPGPVELGLPKNNRIYHLSLKPYYPQVSEDPLLSPGDTVV
ncbi:MAG: phosphopantetheine-binding protein, partial [Deltaproteobacteria bacterium]|nr:phosphopantetheine-binding protein [Deltaproteobacteria bacterium]